jgi:UDP-N-acetylglucosamine 2-epimerase (non-hydrolysing)
MIKILNVAGARPNFMKVAPLVHEMNRHPDIEHKLVHTGQHYDVMMSKVFFDDLGIPAPDVNLEVGAGERSAQIDRIMTRFDPVVRSERPDAVLVVGDVTSTVACARVAQSHGVKVVHVEAGLRSFDRSMPEEINRVLTDAISDWMFVTEPAGRENLLREGADPARIHLVGNVMIDTLVANLARAREQSTLARLGLRAGEYVALTLHRPSNVDDPAKLAALFGVFEELHRQLPVVFPVHPRTRAAIEQRLGGRAPRLMATEPLGYLDFLALMADARFVLTDSGGVQEETTALGVPCLTMRANTERPITVSEGTNTLAGTDPSAIRAEVKKLLTGETKRGRVPSLWDGHAAERIASLLASELETA